ncbi:hypothetical protein DQ04_06121030 [Trypanosoma grayi]|uniref:hypothetical protein n=1 Tax=Trypanosoma grayi TaxID=71804 RepID=UPI0004F3FE6F|nr:hypothetical protein DQ04_06121030 [Trypanosoma grayi]KEG08952.1 hypothetical protein DQ04_06121030 [Trypanosoma grayi]
MMRCGVCAVPIAPGRGGFRGASHTAVLTLSGVVVFSSVRRMCTTQEVLNTAQKALGCLSMTERRATMKSFSGIDWRWMSATPRLRGLPLRVPRLACWVPKSSCTSASRSV